MFLDGKLIWQMKNPDGRKLVNDRKHDAQFSVFSRWAAASSMVATSTTWVSGTSFGQIGEIRISNVRRYQR